ncbi:hypothetical protein QQS21_005734 [Conoideocrella luteorostrata]|uniref:YAG7-like dimerisation domain-containing protein n=1 Tax=Conoideocrella luteorostrata TaxID=1105319 RepID=A0AAJ0FYN7_9HYPO|nr:hypothetical protein QQS21_005734 [Conoideocrella luteorostrata]
MAAAATQSGPKGSKKKLANAVKRADSPSPSVGSGLAADGQDDENPLIRELQKNIRNLNKKITNASKTDSLLRQHAGKSLDELVASRVINTDQKAQIEKKPALQAQLAQTEEQLAQYQKIHEQYRSRAAAEKSEWEKSLEKVKGDAIDEAKAEFQKSMKDNLLTLSQFLRLAAYRREEANDPESDESQAIEGVLLAIYAGDENAVSSMLKLVEGTDDKVLSVPGEQLQTTYSAVKSLAQDYKTPSYNEGAQQIEEAAVTNPTPEHATATEIAATETSAPNGQRGPEAVINGPANTDVADNATNTVAESQWDTDNNLSASQEWVDVKVPRDSLETETGLNATPAAATNTQSWADEQPEPVKQEINLSQQSAPADANDGFHQVQRNKSRQDREGSGNYRGRGRGEHRGRGGHRGDGRGRGRGRGGGPSRPRRSEES